MSTKREEIVSKAREFIGTPFMHQGRIKGAGIDCVGLPIMVGQELALTSFDTSNYPHFPEGDMIVRTCIEQGMQRKSVNAMQPGDMLVLALPHNPCHMAIVAEHDGELTMIHALNAGQNQVVEHIIDSEWKRRVRFVFSFPEVE